MAVFHHGTADKRWRIVVKLPDISGETPPQGWVITLIPRPWLPALSLLMGTAILAGGDSHFSGTSFAGLRLLAPWWVWSMVFGFMGMVQLIPFRPCDEWKVRLLAAIPFALFAVGLLWAVATSPTVAATGVAVYGWAAALHVRMAALRRVEARQRKAPDGH